MKKYTIKHDEVIMIFRHLDEVPYKYAINIVMLLEKSLQPVEEEDKEEEDAVSKKEEKSSKKGTSEKKA